LIGSRPPHATGPRPRGTSSSSSFRRRAVHGARAFTVAEALVVLGIIVVIIGLLVPTVGRVRQSARDVVCINRLHDLSVACTTYFVIHDRYPTPYRGAVAAMPLPGFTFTPSNLPHAVDLNLVNALAPYFKYPPIGPTLPAAALPPAIQSPSVEALMSGRGPFASADPTDPVYYTGYVYAGRMGEWPNLLYVNGSLRQMGNGGTAPTTQGPSFPGFPGPGVWVPPQIPATGLPTKAIPYGIVLRPSRTAQSLSSDQAVLWADDVHLTAAPPAGYWQYAHAKGRAAPGPLPSSYLSSSGCRGQHRSHVDGTVEWVSGTDLGLDANSNNDDASATYRLGAGYWWY
jgi:type II secretory pathway pseudopilin PulG